VKVNKVECPSTNLVQWRDEQLGTERARRCFDIGAADLH
jgi:hypothetical protein